VLINKKIEDILKFFTYKNTFEIYWHCIKGIKGKK